MKKFLIVVLAVTSLATTVKAQSIIDADESRNPNDFYKKELIAGKEAIPYPSVRESDVVWECVIWRDIDFNEKFNQFFYFPIDQSKDTQGRISLPNLLYSKVENGEIPIYDNDDMTAPMEIEQALNMLKGAGEDREVDSTDADGEIVEDEEGEPIKVKKHVDGTFEIASVTKIRLKERWYIDKQDSRQKVRIVGLMFQFVTPAIKDEDGREIPGTGGPQWSFCIPMDDMTVRKALVNANVYDENNDKSERTYDDVFIERMFDSFIVRESNVYNRSLAQYVTGYDAILESQAIEDKIYNIESDMWEY